MQTAEIHFPLRKISLWGVIFMKGGGLMKQEPVKKMKLPKYAAALAVMTAAVGMLTACDSGEVQLDGTAPDPSVTAVQDPALQYEGGMEVYTEPETIAVTTAETVTETVAAECSNPDKYNPQNMGLVPVPALTDYETAKGDAAT